MPVEVRETSFEPEYVFTGCICERGKYGVHDASCPTQPYIPKKPGPYAGQRAWKRYRKSID